MLFLVLSPTEDFSSTHIKNVFPDTFSIQDFSSTRIINVFPKYSLLFFSFWVNFKLKLLKIFSDTRINAFSDTLLHVDCSTCNYLLKTLLHRYSYFHLHYWTKLCMSYMFVFKYIMCIEISPILTQSVFSATISCHKTNFTRNAFKFKLQL